MIGYTNDIMRGGDLHKYLAEAFVDGAYRALNCYRKALSLLFIPVSPGNPREPEEAEPGFCRRPKYICRVDKTDDNRKTRFASDGIVSAKR